MLIGAHVSTAGGLAAAVARGVERACDSIQIFSQSPRAWRPTSYSADDFAAFRDALGDSRIEAVLIHAVYLINCASEDPDLRERSLAALISSLRVGDEIAATAVVLHAGSAKTGAVAPAIARAGEVIAQALTESERCPLHLEDTAGAGGTLGRTFEELSELLDAAGGNGRLGLCLDSCHLLASGHDVRSADSLAHVLADCERTVGLERLGSLHLNDSAVGLGGNRDRHAGLGEGELGPDGLAAFLSEPHFDDLPLVIETGRAGKGPELADVSLARDLREQGLAARALSPARRGRAATGARRSGSRPG